MQLARRTARAMGADFQVSVWAPARYVERFADLAVERVEILEQCWSRFRPDSELSRLNARAGAGAVSVSDDLLRLVRTLVAAAEWTSGAVDGTVLRGMVAMGYNADFSVVAAQSAPGAWIARPAAGMRAVDVSGSQVTLPSGTGLDPGAIGKGLAGDIVSEELLSAGASAVLIGIGGDVVARGAPPRSGGWRVAVLDDRAGTGAAPMRPVDVVELPAHGGAVATSSTIRRRWAGRHHLLDPSSGLPARSDLVQATVVAESGWRAEAAATAALCGGQDVRAWLSAQGLAAYLFLAAAPVGSAERIHA